MPIHKFLIDINQLENNSGVQGSADYIEFGFYPTAGREHFTAPPATTDLWISWYQAFQAAQHSGFDHFQITNQDNVAIINGGYPGGLSPIGFNVQGGARNTENLGFGANNSGTGRYDIHIDTIGGAVELYIDGNLVAQWTGTFTGVTSIGGVSWKTGGNVASPYGCEIYWAFMADEDTRPIFITESYPTANGAVQGWAGDETMIDGYVIDDGNVIISNTAEQTSVFVTGDLPSAYAAGYSVMAFGVVARARALGVGGPRSLAVAARSGTTIGNGDTKALTTGFAPYQSLITLDPNTGAAWTYASINAAQIGVTSKA